MAQPSGHNVKAAIGRPTTNSDYDNVASAPTNQIPLRSEGMTNSPVIDREESVIGAAGTQSVETVGYNVSGNANTEAWFEGLEYLFHAALGFECPTVYVGAYGTGAGGSPALDTATSPDAFVHVFECDENLHREGWLAGERAASSGSSGDAEYWRVTDQKIRSFDFGINKTVPTSYVHEYLGCMVNSMSLSTTPGKVTLDWSLVGRKHERDSAMNYSNWALPDSMERALFSGLEFRVGAVGATLTTTYPVQEFTLNLENNLDSSFAASSTASGMYIQEPIRGDNRAVAGSIKLARFSDSDWQDWMDGETDIQIHAIFTGPSIDGSTLPYKMEFVLPKCRVLKAEFPVGGPGVITGAIEFEAIKPDSTQTWLTTLLGGVTQIKDNELLVFLTNTRQACVSRDDQVSGVSLP
jgi:Phage tail tube protein